MSVKRAAKFVIASGIAALTHLAAMQAIFGQGDFDFGDFEEEGRGAAEEASPLTLPLRGTLALESAYQTGDPRWIRLGPSLHLILDASTKLGLFYGEATGRYNGAYRHEGDSEETIEGYELEGVLRELYWKKSFSFFTVTLGNVMTVWTKADILPVTDVVSANDMTQSFFANPGETRLGQNMARLDLFFKNGDLSLVAIPFPAVDRITEGDHPYSFLGSAGSASMGGASLALKDSGEELEAEWGARLNVLMGKSEAAIMAGRFNVRQPIMSLQWAGASAELIKHYEAYTFLGGSYNLVVDPLLFKVEAGYGRDKPMQGLDELLLCAPACATLEIPGGVVRSDEAALSVGVDVNLGGMGSIIAEGSIRKELGSTSGVYPGRDVLSGGIGYSNTFAKELLSFSTFIFFLEDYRNILYRLQGSYKVSDKISVFAQFTQIEVGAYRESYGAIEDFDRGDVLIQYHFDLSIR